MFTGLVEATTEVLALAPRAEGAALRLRSIESLAGLALGDSLAVNGCCLTVTEITPEALSFDVLQETLRCTNLGSLTGGQQVNLERSLRADSRLGGHFVQGHVDQVGRLQERRETAGDLLLRFEILPKNAGYLVLKGSISVNGVSLTVAEVAADSFAVWVIPHTRLETNLNALAVGDLVNLEFDILAKYVERQLTQRA